MEELNRLLENSTRPVIIAGGGVRLSHASFEFKEMITKHRIPVVATAMGLDLLEHTNPYYIGHGGTKGNRSANIVLQKADLIISIGSRLCISFVGHNPSQFAPNAKKIVVDVDEKEHSKKTIKIDKFIKMDAKEFINKMRKMKRFDFNKWNTLCLFIKEQYFNFLCSPMYKAVEKISQLSKPDDIFTTDSGVTAFVAIQTIRIKSGQRFIVPGTLTMGYGLPAIVGMWATKPKGNLIAIIGDGSFPMSVHELQTIIYNKIPAKIFVINNEGYLAIRTTEKNNFGRLIGESNESGISFPSIKKIAKAYGITYYRNNILKAMEYKGTVICEIMTPKWQPHLTVKFGKPNDDMFPPIENGI